MRDRILLVDGNHNLHRSCHVPSLADLEYDGVKTGGIYGFLNSLRDTVSAYPLDKVFVVWDGGRSSRRMTLFPEYKPRPDPSKDPEYSAYLEFFRSSRDYLVELMPNIGVRSIRVTGREADDVIGYLTQHNQDTDFVVMSEDLDFAQLIDSHVLLWRPVRREQIGLSNFKERLGVLPEYFKLFKAMVGDGSDGIPGIKGVGDNTAKIVCELYEEKQGMVGIEDLTGHKSSRVRKVGENWDIVRRNNDLMDITLEQLNPEEKSYLSDILEDKTNTFCELEMIRVLNRFGMRSITDDWTRWSQPFLRLAYAQS